MDSTTYQARGNPMVQFHPRIKGIPHSDLINCCYQQLFRSGAIKKMLVSSWCSTLSTTLDDRTFPSLLDIAGPEIELD